MNADVNSLVEKIATHSGLSKDEILKRIREKVNAFAGLLTEVGAAYAVAKELGVDIDVEKDLNKRVPISQLKPGMERIRITGRIVRIYPPRTFEKDGKVRKYCRIVVADNTGEITVTLWNRDVKYVEEGQIKIGDAVEILNARIKEYNGKTVASLSFDSRIIVTDEEDNIPPRPAIKKIAELTEEDNNVHIMARVLRIFPERTIETENGPTNMISMIVGDETGTARLVVWDSKKAKGVQEGDSILITSAYVQTGERGTSIHVGKMGIIQKISEDVPVKDGRADRQPIARKRLEDLKEGDRFVAVRATITRVLRTSRLLLCKKCGKRVTEENGKYVCENCGETEAVEKTVLAIELDDGTGRIRAVIFGELADRILEDVGGDVNLPGEEIVASGYVKTSPISGKPELIIKDATRPNYDEEIKRLLQIVKSRLGE